MVQRRPDHDGRNNGDAWFQAAWFRQYGLVFQFLGTLGLLGYIGYRVDEIYGCTPWGLLVGLAFGTAGGIYPMVREGLRQDRNGKS